MKKTGRTDLKEAFGTLKKQVRQMTRRNYWNYIENLIIEDSSNNPKPTKKLLVLHQKQTRRTQWSATIDTKRRIIGSNYR